MGKLLGLLVSTAIGFVFPPAFIVTAIIAAFG
jgi:hypothetical protein